MAEKHSQGADGHGHGQEHGPEHRHGGEAGPPPDTAPPPGRRWRRALLVLPLALLLALGLFWARLAWMPLSLPEGLQTRIEDRINGAMETGDLAIGDMVLALSRGGRAPALEFRDVALTGPGGDARAELPFLRLRLAPGALLGGQVRVQQVVVSGAGVNLRRAKDGRIGLDFAATEAAADTGAERRDAPRLARPPISLVETLARLDAMVSDPVFAELDAVQGTGMAVLLTDDMTGRVLRLHGAEMRLARQGGGLDLVMGGQLAGSRDAVLRIGLSRDPGAGRTEMRLAFDSLAARDLAAISPALAWLDLMRAPIDGELVAAMDDDGTLGAVRGSLDIGPGQITLPVGLGQTDDLVAPDPAGAGRGGADLGGADLGGADPAVQPGQVSDLPTDLSTDPPAVLPADPPAGPPDTAPLDFTAITAAIDYDPATRRIRVDRVALTAAQLSFTGRGHADIAEGGDVLTAQIALADIEAAPEGLLDAPVSLDGAALDLRLHLGEALRVELGQAVIHDADLRATLRGEARVDPAGLALALDATMAAADLRTILSFWPVTAIPRTRSWIAERLLAAEASGIDFALRRSPGAAPVTALSFDFSGADIRALPAAPPIRGASGYLDLRDRTLVVGLTGGGIAAGPASTAPPVPGATPEVVPTRAPDTPPARTPSPTPTQSPTLSPALSPAPSPATPPRRGQQPALRTAARPAPISLAGTRVVIEDLSVRGPLARFEVNLAGRVPDLMHLLAGPPFDVLADSPLTPDQIGTGEVTARATLATRLLPRDTPAPLAELGIAVAGHVTGYRATRLIPDRTLSAARLTLALSPESLTIGGPAELDGVALTGQWRTALGPDAPPGSRVTARATLDRAALETFGIRLPDWLLSGAGPADLTVALQTGQPALLGLRSDLDGIGLAVPPLAWRLAPERTGALAAEIRLGPDPAVTSLTLEAGGLSLDAALSFTPERRLDRLTASRFRIGQWIDVEGALVGRGTAAPAIEVSGGVIDVRTMPSLTGTGGTRGSGGTGEAGPVTLALDRLQITGGIALTDLRAAIDGASRGGSFTSRVNGRAAVTGEVIPGPNGPSLRLQSDDGGQVMRAAGVFENLHGGPTDLILTARPERGQYDGRLTVDSPRLRDAPVMAELLNAISVIGLLEQLSGDGINLGEVSADFRVTPDRLTLTQGTALGPAIGLSMDGVYDLASRRYEMQGVVSPLYAVNGLLGALFAPRREGLFGFNYRVIGSGADTRVSVNPLSILTPGIFREIFRAPPPDFTRGAPGQGAPGQGTAGGTAGGGAGQ